MNGGDIDAAAAPVIEMLGDGQALVNGVVMAVPGTDNVVDLEKEGGAGMYKLNTLLAAQAFVMKGSSSQGDSYYANGLMIDEDGFFETVDPEQLIEDHKSVSGWMNTTDGDVFFDGAVFSTMAQTVVLGNGQCIDGMCTDGVVEFK
jgi:hypothetical protein